MYSPVAGFTLNASFCHAGGRDKAAPGSTDDEGPAEDTRCRLILAPFTPPDVWLSVSQLYQ